MGLKVGLLDVVAANSRHMSCCVIQMFVYRSTVEHTHSSLTLSSYVTSYQLSLKPFTSLFLVFFLNDEASWANSLGPSVQGGLI